MYRISNDDLAFAVRVLRRFSRERGDGTLRDANLRRMAGVRARRLARKSPEALAGKAEKTLAM